ncbi:hypothetical protein IR083_18515 [Dysgonomonas sp. GY75]|uniref:hypothetical protein n=1 Tax=Dysgonomonas sp. GY75 TaxID=2780419 RepID=UPI0018837BEC|nr:hypothetical protein [Dysgonomonas sp. GY75]MBF0650816.1 hypothetical protein [Dysgonomonas sp. GY75]
MPFCRDRNITIDENDTLYCDGLKTYEPILPDRNSPAGFQATKAIAKINFSRQ